MKRKYVKEFMDYLIDDEYDEDKHIAIIIVRKKEVKQSKEDLEEAFINMEVPATVFFTDKEQMFKKVSFLKKNLGQGEHWYHLNKIPGSKVLRPLRRSDGKHAIIGQDSKGDMFITIKGEDIRVDDNYIIVSDLFDDAE